MATPENIYLVGLMGAGKTTVGRQLASRLGKTFLDCDQELERRTGADIPLIFDIEGEEGFRRREHRMLSELVGRRDVVLATGGGVVLMPENRELLRENGFVVYLQATVELLYARTGRDRRRPLLQTEDPKARIAELYETRDPLYREVADLIVTTGQRNPRYVAREIMKAFE